MRYSIILTSICLLLWFLAMGAGGDEPKPNPSAQETSVDFSAYAKINRDDLILRMEDRASAKELLERQIVTELKADVPINVRLAAIYLAGLYRVESAAPVLAGMIDFRDKNDVAPLGLPLWTEFPAADALARIGNPAIPWILRNLATSDNLIVRERSAVVLRVIIGAALARHAIEDAIRKAGKDEKQAARLEAALTLIKED